MILWYLAHPVASDRQYSFKENMAHSLACARAVWDAGFKATAPWHIQCLYLGDVRPVPLSILEFDAALVERLDGIILTGHRLSHGMSVELSAAVESDKQVLNLIGIPSHKITQTLAEHYKDASHPMHQMPLRSQPAQGPTNVL